MVAQADYEEGKVEEEKETFGTYELTRSMLLI
jgi:hypothetical protein